ncbi:MAG TPA: cytochrome c oxidase subunit II [Frankiaceae bacterium]|nr:cytochrome c oxidase subunit II [Frankiaceae bacterium]
MRPVGPRLRSRLRLAAVAVLPLLLTACAQQPQTEQGKKVYTLYNITLAIAVLIGVGVISMILLSCVRYRKQPGDESMPPQTHGNTVFEVVWTAIPTVIVLALFGMSFVTIRAIDKPSGNHAAIIEVRGYQWSWTFDYGTNAAGTRVLVKTESNRTPPQMIVPVGEKVHIEQRSDNVMHSFFVPAFLFKRDLIPGKANGFDITVTSPGVYHGQCAELCGTDHAQMTFSVKGVSRAEFDKWFNEFRPPLPKCEDTAKAATEYTVTALQGRAEWETPCAYLKAGGPVSLTMHNQGGLPHNIAVFEGPMTENKPVGKPGKIINSGSDTVALPALEAGKDYRFYCQVHPLMEGLVKVSP